jgi:PKD repeat protein
MRRLVLLAALATVLGPLLPSSRASAEEVSVGWRSPYGHAWSAAVNPSDGSCWAGLGSTVTHVSAQGELLSQTGGFDPFSVAVDSRDGSCWVADWQHDRVVKLDRRGREVVEFGGLHHVGSVSANSADGSCWAALRDDGVVVHIGADGEELWRGDSFVSPWSVSVNSYDGSCWVADAGGRASEGYPGAGVIHLSATGAELLRQPIVGSLGVTMLPQSVSVVASDGSCWVGTVAPPADRNDRAIVLLAEDGTEQAALPGGSLPGTGARVVAANVADGSCWAKNGLVLQHVWLNPEAGEAEVLSGRMASLEGIAVNPLDGSIWTVEANHLGLAHRAQTGVLLGVVDVNGTAQALSDVGDGSLWVAFAGDWDAAEGQYVGASVQRLAPDGTVLASSGAFQDPCGVAAKRDDRSCWALDRATGEAVHLSASGDELARVGGFDQPEAISVDESNYSVWIADTGHDAVAHLDPTGVGLSSTGGFLAPVALAARSDQAGNVDGCWVADTGNGEAVFLNHNGGEQTRGGSYVEPKGIAARENSRWVADTGSHRVVNGLDADVANDSFVTPTEIAIGPSGSRILWVTDEAGKLSLLDQSDARELWSIAVSHPTAMAANVDLIPSFVDPDLSVWVASGDERRIYHYAAEGGSVRWSGRAFYDVGQVAAYGGDGSCWVSAVVPPGRLLRFAGNGDLLAEAPVSSSGAMAVDQSDGSVWVTTRDPAPGSDYAPAHLSATGQVLTTLTGYRSGNGLDLNPHDGTLWFGHNSATTGEAFHVKADGTLLSTTPGFTYVMGLSVNPTDDTCWVADANANAVVHLGADGTELGRLTDFDRPQSVAVDPADGSIWVTEQNTSTQTAKISHLTSDGTVIWSEASFGPLALNRQDHTVWVSDAMGQVRHLAADGTELSRSGDVLGSPGLSVDPVDGSVWAGDYYADEVVHLVLGLHADFRASPTSGAAPLSVQFTDASAGGPTSWSWDFGDSATSTQDSPSHQYATPGAYSVSLTVSSGANSDTAQKQYLIQAGPLDVPADFWAFPQIFACLQGGLVAGFPDGRYQPALPVTRDQMAVYIARGLAGGDANLPTGPATPSFPDVSTDHWAYPYIEYCYAQHIVQGYWDNSYRPQEPVTRDQMAVYVARSVVNPRGEAGLAYYAPPTTPSFPDVPVDWWAFKYIEYCRSHAIVQGFPDGTYQPGVVVTRDQMAVYVQRAFQLAL